MFFFFFWLSSIHSSRFAAYLHYGDSPNRSFEGVVLLRGAKVEHSPDTLSRRAHCFSLSNSNRTYYFAAGASFSPSCLFRLFSFDEHRVFLGPDTEEEMVDWIVSLMAVIKEANNPSPVWCARKRRVGR